MVAEVILQKKFSMFFFVKFYVRFVKCGVKFVKFNCVFVKSVDFWHCVGGWDLFCRCDFIY